MTTDPERRITSFIVAIERIMSLSFCAVFRTAPIGLPRFRLFATRDKFERPGICIYTSTNHEYFLPLNVA
jgi:hypothetical protein